MSSAGYGVVAKVTRLGTMNVQLLLCVGLLICVNFLLLTKNKERPYELLTDVIQQPMIIVGGHQSSGTGLMRVLLDAHPWITCGPEPQINMLLLEWRQRLSKAAIDQGKACKYYPDGFDRAMAHFIYEIVRSMGPPANRLCQKLPHILLYTEYMHHIFPSAKFIHMVRDGRGAIESTVRRGVDGNYKDGNDANSIQLWETITAQMLRGCQKVGRQYCLSVRYEHLVMNPERVMRDVLEFLDIPWDPIVLHHEDVLKHLTNLVPHEASSSQVQKKIHTDSLALWYGETSKLNRRFVESIHKFNKLLKQLNYAEIGIPPNYTLLPYNVPEIH